MYICKCFFSTKIYNKTNKKQKILTNQMLLKLFVLI